MSITWLSSEIPLPKPFHVSLPPKKYSKHQLFLAAFFKNVFPWGGVLPTFSWRLTFLKSFTGVSGVFLLPPPSHHGSVENGCGWLPPMSLRLHRWNLLNYWKPPQRPLMQLQLLSVTPNQRTT